jgi:hypothetical protein
MSIVAFDFSFSHAKSHNIYHGEFSEAHVPHRL